MLKFNQDMKYIDKKSRDIYCDTKRPTFKLIKKAAKF